METPPPAAAPSLPTPAEFETVVAALQSTDSSNRQQAQQLLQRLQQQQEDCTGFCLTVIEAARDPAVATVAAVLLRSAALWHWNARIAASAAAKKRLAAAPPGEAAAAAGQAAAAAAEALQLYVQRMQQLTASIVLMLQQKAAAGCKGSGERQLSHAFCCLAKKGLATDPPVFLPALKQILMEVVAKGFTERIPLFWMSLLAETAQEMQLQQQQGMHLSLQQHAACCRSFQQQLLLPLLQFVLQRLQFILDNPQPQGACKEEIAGILLVIETACSWSFGHMLLRLSSVDELSLAPPAEWIPVFFPQAAAAAAAAGAGGGGTGAATAAAPGGLPPPLPQQEGLFVLVLRLYKLLREMQQQQQQQGSELFATCRYLLQRVAKFRPLAMADALLGGEEGGDAAANSGASAASAGILPLKKSYSGPVARSKKQKLTLLVYVPLLQVLLDLVETCAFYRSLPGAPETPGGSQGPQSPAAQGVPSSLQDVEEAQDLCAALANVA
ncbi:hypothetical protein, conserved, partial [Eimeria maxima]